VDGAVREEGHSVIVVGGLLVVAGVIAYIGGMDTAAGSWWLLPAGLIAAGIGMLAASAVTVLRRRLAPFRHAFPPSAGPASAGGPLRRLRVVPAMILGAWRGRALLPRYQTVLWLAAVVYLISPIDFITDVVLPVLGIPGDIGLGAWLLTSIYTEAGHYLAQQRTQDTLPRARTGITPHQHDQPGDTQ
jgi:uncharacterized membrane protein YkvA (DUF1232 family)